MKILVLGGTYFIGKVLTQKLLKTKEYEITLLNRGTKKQEIKSLPISLIKVDRTNAECMRKVLSNRVFDVVFDISGYNEKDVSLVPDHPKCISVEDGEYSFNKWQAESFLWNEQQKEELNVTVVRPVYVYGPYNYRKREALIFEKALKGLPLHICGNGENIIQFGFVEDLVEAMLVIAGNKLAYGEAFNVSGYELITVNTFIHLVANVVGKDIEIIHRNKNIPGESDLFPKIHRFADISKIKDILGVKPKICLLEGLKRTAEWFLKSPKKEGIS